MPKRAGAEDLRRSANMLGALSLAIVDRTSESVEGAGPPGTAAAALSAMHHFLQSPSVDMLRRVLGVSHSGTVRLVDRLETAGLVVRGPGRDGRSASLSLTASGKVVARAIADARLSTLQSALHVLTPAERDHLDDLVGRLLVGMMRGPGAEKWICRMCDIGACRSGPGCPIHNEARIRYGVS